MTIRRYAGPIVLAAIFLVLLVVVLVTQPKSPTTPSVAVPPTLSAEQVKLQIIRLPQGEQPSRLEIKQLDPAKIIAFKYEGAAWKIDGRENIALDTSLVSTNVGQLTQLNGQQLVQEQGALTEFGLDKPTLSIALTSPSGTKTLLVGNVNQISKLYYVKLDNDPKVWTLPPSLVDTFKAWLDTPPVAPPTPTPLPTLPPTPTPNLTASVAALTPAATGAATTPPGTTPEGTTVALPATTPTP